MAPTTAQRHLAAIESKRITKTNVIGIRKALSHVDRIRAGWSGNRCNVTPAEADAMESALSTHQPAVVCDLHNSGIALLRSPRYRKRFNAEQTAIINAPDIRFNLIRFDREGRSTIVPVYRVTSAAGQFCFRNLPWQAAWVEELESGPVIVPDSFT